MSIDTSRIGEFILIVNDIWSALLQICLALYLLWEQLGIASIAGLGVMFIVLPINGYISGQLRYLTNKLMKIKDLRVKLMHEILCGIKVLKLYAWETSFEKQVMEKRNQEIKQLTKRAYFQGFMAFLFNSTPLLVFLN
jgi:ABC-type multidrug transport system fused ATPase/permease subunit